MPFGIAGFRSLAIPASGFGFSSLAMRPSSVMEGPSPNSAPRRNKPESPVTKPSFPNAGGSSLATAFLYHSGFAFDIAEPGHRGTVAELRSFAIPFSALLHDRSERSAPALQHPATSDHRRREAEICGAPVPKHCADQILVDASAFLKHVGDRRPSRQARPVGRPADTRASPGRHRGGIRFHWRTGRANSVISTGRFRLRKKRLPCRLSGRQGKQDR